MYRPLKLVILDENNTPLAFEKGIRLTMQRELYTPFTALNAEFVSESSLNASRMQHKAALGRTNCVSRHTR